MILTPDNEYAVLLDACVLVPMPLCDTLLRLAEEPAFYRPIWSAEILDEVGRTLENKFRIPAERVARRRGFMEKYFPEALVDVPETLVAGLTCIPDENDRHVLAAAIRGQVNAIITLNERDFPEDCLKQYDLLRQHPDEFLVHQFHLLPELLLQKIDEQAGLIKKDRAFIAEKLRPITPAFAELVSSRS